MKSILEHLFSSLLDSNNLVKSSIGKSENAKDVLSDNSEGFAADLNGFLINEKQDGTEKSSDIDISVNKEESNNISNLKKKGMNKSQTVLGPKAEINIEDESSYGNKDFPNKNIENKSNTNHKSIYNSNTAMRNNIVLANFDKKKNQAFSVASKYSASNEIEIDKIKKNKKIKTFFTNYLNFSSSKNINKNKKFLKFILSNGLMSEVTKKTQELKKINMSSQNNKDTTNISTMEKNPVLSNNRSVELNLNLDGSEDQKSNNLSTTTNNIFKNILDIKSSNINQRLAEIFERNIKLGNNKFEIEIKPENLGKIEISMEINGDKVDINMKVDNNSVANIITESNSNLQKSLASQGLNLTSLNLSYNNQNKFGEDSSRKGKKDDTKKNVKEEESVDLKIEKHHKNNNLVYIKA